VFIESVNGAVTTEEGIEANGDLTVISNNALTLNSTTGNVASAGADVILASIGDVMLNGNVDSGGEVAVYSFTGQVQQQENSIINSVGSIVLSAETGMTISQLASNNDITLVLTTLASDPLDPVSFARANEPVPPGQGDTSPDISSAGAIVFLAPVADVGGKENDQNFVQRSTEGIFYGLDAGKFYSDDIGTAPILNTIPADTQGHLDQVTQNVLTASSQTQVTADADFTIESTLAIFGATLAGATTAEADAGDTSFKSSSKSTAASQKKDEEEVTEVDETAFQNLTSYEENPQGIALPADQQFAYDEEGNIYYLVRYRDSGESQSISADGKWQLYKVSFNPEKDDDEKAQMEQQENVDVSAIRETTPVFIRLTMAEPDLSSGDD
jgi:hypothetical protein